MTETITSPLINDLFGAEPPTRQARSAAALDAIELESTAYRRAVARSKDHFDSETANHVMTVVHDASPASPHRHLSFQSTTNRLYGFEIVTWPGHLHVGGQIEAYTFRRIPDMMDFFNSADINPGYWGEKAVSGKVEGFDEEVYKETVLGQIEDLSRYRAVDQEAIKAAVYDELIEADPCNAENARQMLGDFGVYLSDDTTFDFGSDVWELDVEGFHYHFLMACHAVKYGVDAYRKQFPLNVIKETR